MIKIKYKIQKSSNLVEVEVEVGSEVIPHQSLTSVNTM